jgi:aryl sulfotransferase
VNTEMQSSSDSDSSGVSWPLRTREVHNHSMDSTVWDGVKFRDDDIVVATYSKSGTTWVQQIVAQLLFDGDPDVSVAELSTWVDARVPPVDVKLPQIEEIEHRRFLKTHLPVDALRFSPRAKYVYVGRDGRDVVWSLYNHFINGDDSFYAMMNDAPGLVGPPLERPPADVAQYWRGWMDGDGYPFWSFWESVRSWWAIRDLPNVDLVHFEDLKRDLPGGIRRLAEFLEITVNESRWDVIVEHCTFEWMKEHAELSVPLGGSWLKGGAATFINKGTNGRWADTLSAVDSAEYESRAVQELDRECARWLAQGSAIM